MFANRAYPVSMPTRNVNLTPQLNRYVDARIRSGHYANASEVMRAGLRALEQDEREDLARLKALRSAIVAGEKSGVAEGDVFGEVRERIRRHASERP